MRKYHKYNYMLDFEPGFYMMNSSEAVIRLLAWRNGKYTMIGNLSRMSYMSLSEMQQCLRDSEVLYIDRNGLYVNRLVNNGDILTHDMFDMREHETLFNSLDSVIVADRSNA